MSLKGMNIIIGCLVFVSIWITNSYAQDARFSQYYAAPTYLNPALSGAYEGNFRVSTSYRDQWRNAMANPFVTYTFSADARFDIKRRGKRLKDAASGGILVLRDQVDVIDYSTTFIAIVGAYHKNLNPDKATFLSAGFRVGIGQKSINYENLSFLDQFNGVGLFNLSTAEILPANDLSYPDLALGLHFSTRPTKLSQFTFGGSVDHLIPANVSFYQNGIPNNPDAEFPENILPMRISGDVTYLFPIINKRTFLRPRALINVQDNFMEIFAGSSFKYKISNYGDKNIVLGAFVRANNLIDDFGPTTLVGLVGFDIGSLRMGFSYDMNIDDTPFGKRNSFELSLTYIGSYYNDSYLCPSF